MKEESFSDMEYRCRKKKTKREEFLDIMEEIIMGRVGVPDHTSLPCRKARPSTH